jgi:hypothetical protein
MMILPSFTGLGHADIAKIMHSNCGWADNGNGAPDEYSVVLCMIFCAASLYIGGLPGNTALDFFSN